MGLMLSSVALNTIAGRTQSRANKMPAKPQPVNAQVERAQVERAAQNRLAEPAVESALAEILTKYEQDYFSSDNKQAFAQESAETLFKTGVEAVAQLKISVKHFHPLFVVHIFGLETRFTRNFQPAIKSLAEFMLNDVMSKINADKNNKVPKVKEDPVIQLQKYTATTYAQELQVPDSTLALEIKKLIIRYVWAYTVVAEKDVVVTRYAKDLVNTLIRPYAASQEEAMIIIAVVINHINTHQREYVEDLTVSMGELVKYLRVQSK